MNTYKSLSKIFPKSFSAKIFFIAFIGTHVPLIVTVLLILFQRDGFFANLHIILIMLLATVVGAAATLYFLRAILRPLYQVHSAMEAFELRREKVELSDSFKDEIGEIMSMTRRLISNVDLDLRQKTDAALTDPLTGLMNRRGFEARVTQGLTGAIIYVDVDHFKLVNDQHGHNVGDLALQGVAKVLAQVLRKRDVISRFGGDEFVAFLPGADIEEANRVADRARVKIAENVTADGLRVTASFGLALLRTRDNVETAIKLADTALSKAKSTGKNQVGQ